MRIIDNISGILLGAGGNDSHVQPTFLYNEGWMLKLVLDWFEKNPTISHSLTIPDNCNWFSEGLLPSAFLHSPRGKKLSEGYTHADAIVGRFTIGVVDNKGAVELKEDCDYLYVCEAKINSPLSPGVTNCKKYNQAARNVACIAELIYRLGNDIEKFRKIGFYVLMPAKRDVIDKTIRDHFCETVEKMKKESIMQVVKERIEPFPDDFRINSSIGWLEKNLTAIINKFEINVISWEEILDFIGQHDPFFHKELTDFYEKCVEFNKNVSTN